jgi:hypothetical protein
MTVTDRRTGKTVDVTVNASTQISAVQASTPVSQIKNGEQVSVFGTQNSDGSVTATRVLVGPAGGSPICGRRVRSSPTL